MPRISAEFPTVDIWIKRDDLTGLALGGNKGRKLEYLLSEALDQDVEVVVTCGALQSNFVRQLGAACSMLGLGCAAAVMELPYEGKRPEGRRLSIAGGNRLLDDLFQVDLRIYPDGTWEELYGLAERLAVEYEAKGKRVYRIPVGGSSPLGALAFYEAAKEIRTGFDWIVFASSSGATHTGLAYGFYGSQVKVLGIASDPEPELVNEFARIGQGLAYLIEAKHVLGPEEFLLNVDYVGPGYGLPSNLGDAAILHMARSEGILLDPVYTGKAFGALLDLVFKGEISGQVLFWHTGGVPTLFAR